MEGGNSAPIILSFLNHDKRRKFFVTSMQRLFVPGKKSQYALSNKPNGLYRCLRIVENQKNILHLPGLKLEFLCHHSVHTAKTEICRLLA